MAVEDGATLGILLGLLFKSGPSSEVDQPNSIAAVLEVYESLRKQRTTTIVQGAVMNRTLYHMHDGPECEVRDDALRNVDWHDPQSKIFWHWANLRDQTALMGYDTITRAFEGFETWQRGSKI